MQFAWYMLLTKQSGHPELQVRIPEPLCLQSRLSCHSLFPNSLESVDLVLSMHQLLLQIANVPPAVLVQYGPGVVASFRTAVASIGSS